MIARMYELFHKELLRYMIGSTRSVAEAEDIVSETFLRAMDNASVLDAMSESQCRAWLYRTAKNLFIDRARRKKAEPPLPETAVQEDDLTWIEVDSMCGVLGQMDRAIFLLRYFEGYNASEIGRIFGMSPEAVRARLMVARSRMRAEYVGQKRKDGKK